MDANLDLKDIERVEMSLQNLIGASHINCEVQKWSLEKVTNMQKIRFEEKKIYNIQINIRDLKKRNAT